MLDSFSKKESDGALTRTEADDGQSNIVAVVFIASKVTLARNHNNCVRLATHRQVTDLQRNPHRSNASPLEHCRRGHCSARRRSFSSQSHQLRRTADKNTAVDENPRRSMLEISDVMQSQKLNVVDTR
ncbi:hypothetical protein I6F35_10565 [Bradyrhizobium sp. BRP22]|uniref:hypothetical protein n=1 Tax=Bradyrhizobium sp. BRP22 TaxID=2793821 RepID=UPI001CD2FF74|nr:hypothetical protein [Bradyrhizobium sp. BRP22]MCA1453652.1 hypothetical protein [Bradyrhizobium sp. BRP22]